MKITQGYYGKIVQKRVSEEMERLKGSYYEIKRRRSYRKV